MYITNILYIHVYTNLPNINIKIQMRILKTVQLLYLLQLNGYLLSIIDIALIVIFILYLFD